jgi:hypothetical protein
LFGAEKAVLRPVACDPLPGARARGQGTEAHTRGQKLGEQAIVVAGSSNVVLPQFTANVTFNVEGEAPDLSLACLIYFDDKTRLQQAFVYRLARRDIAVVFIDEIEQPDYGEFCN